GGGGCVAGRQDKTSQSVLCINCNRVHDQGWRTKDKKAPFSRHQTPDKQSASTLGFCPEGLGSCAVLDAGKKNHDLRIAEICALLVREPDPEVRSGRQANGEAIPVTVEFERLVCCEPGLRRRQFRYE